ncbi:MAG: A/G-specific adenine glycosylase [Flavobacteriales bacterium]|jgi:A/G-specific adenine glycosylase
MNPAHQLISWYNEQKRDLPWRHTTDPYPVWLSEVILQQTRVNQGMSYYFKFLELFPTVFDLANATEADVLKAWQGLGYYSRARNLHATAKRVAFEMGGVFPGTSHELKKLKGIGEYTAAAIASFCFGECVPVMDGNVQRVVSRLIAMGDPVDKPSGKLQIQEMLNSWIDPKRPDIFNQAMMEFGALQCTPQKPTCDECVLKTNCKAYNSGRVFDFPVKSGKTKVTDVWMYYMIVVHDSQVLVRHRLHSGIWKGLYDFPSVDAAEQLLNNSVYEEWLSVRDITKGAVLKSGPVEMEHVLSHRRIHATFFEFSLKKKCAPAENEKWVHISEISQLGVSRLVDRYIINHSKLPLVLE